MISMKQLLLPILLFLLHTDAVAQHIQYDLPKRIDPMRYYMFYLHGGVVTVKGDNEITDAVPEWGPYQYSRILDTLRAHSFYVISERRLPGMDDSVYVRKIVKQVDTLLKAKVPLRNIVLVGASAGSDIVLHVAGRLRKWEMKYVIMGGCWPDTYKDYLNLNIAGRFLSVIESSDPHGTCAKIFENRSREEVDLREFKLETGLSHGFIYKPYAAWVEQVVSWFGIYTQDYRTRNAGLVDGH